MYFSIGVLAVWTTSLQYHPPSRLTSGVPGRGAYAKTKDADSLQWTFVKSYGVIALPKTYMTMVNPPFEDVFPIENGDFPMAC